MNNVKLHRNIKEVSEKEKETDPCNGDKGKKSKTCKRVQRAVMTNDEISDMLPAKFEQIYLRLVWKGDTSPQSYQEILIEFSKLKGYDDPDVKIDFIDTMQVGDSEKRD